MQGLVKQFFTNETATQWAGRNDVYFMCDIRQLTYNREEDLTEDVKRRNEDIVWGDMLSQQEWVKIIKPVKSFLKFRLPYSWDFIQKDPQFKNKTSIFITTDHGRGDKNKEEWTSHGQSIADAYEIWFGVMGPGIPAKGEMKISSQLYQEQFAQTIAKMLGYTFKANHPVSTEIKSALNK